MMCVICGGQLENKNDKFISDADECVVIIKDVPAQVCSQCFEVYYDNETSKQIEKIVDAARATNSEMYITDYK